MEQQYRMNQDNQSSNVSQKPADGFLRVWGPLFVKWGISMVVSFVAIIIIEIIVLMKNHGLEITALQDLAKLEEILPQYMSDSASAVQFTNELMAEYLNYSTPVEGVAAVLTIPFLLVMFHRDRVREKLAGILSNKKASLWKYIYIIVMMFAVTIGVNNLLQMSGLAGVSEDYEQTMSALYSASLPVQLLCLGILVPICEELVFRGLMFQRIRQNNTFLRAALYSSMVFGFLHINMVQMIYGFLLGMVFCWLYEKYGSVKAPVLAHMAANITSVIMTYVGGMNWLLENEMRMGIITVLCGTVASSMYVLVQKIEEKPKDFEESTS